MIKQDYLLRMIQEIITLLVNALLNRQKIRKESWVEYDDITRQILGVPSENLKDMSADEIINRYARPSVTTKHAPPEDKVPETRGQSACSNH